MSIGVLHGQTGGIKLPFRVIGGTTQPSNPKDGDIWVKTSVPITHLEFNNNTWASGGVGMVFLDGTLGGSNPTGTNTTVYVLNTKVGGIIHREKVVLTGCKQVQGSKGNWVNLYAYRYYGGKWVQFSSEFNATINITYPAGSTCTVTDGTTTLTAPNTSGTWACVVPNAGTWTVSITNNAGTKSKDVAITSNGQTANCILGAPSDYQEVIYLQSTGTQYIDTKLTGKTYRFRVTAKASFDDVGGTLYGDLDQPYMLMMTHSSGNMHATVTYNGAAVGDKLDAGTIYNLDKECSADGILTVKNNGETIATYDASRNGFDKNRTYSPFIFSRNYGNSADSKIKAKLYWFTIYDIDNTTLLREFVPCYRKSDSVAGLYDLVNDVFYTNSGSGTFVVGGDV